MQKYDISTDKWETLSEYPDAVQFSSAVTAIDNNRDLFYIFPRRRGCIVFNFIQNKWVGNIFNGSVLYASEAKALVLPNGELQVFRRNSMKHDHVRLNKDTKKFGSICKTPILDNCYFDGIDFVYVPSKKWLMQIGGYIGSDNGGVTDKIWYTEYIPNKSDYEWKLFPLRLKTTANARVVVAFDFVIIAFTAKMNLDKTKSWILDLNVDNDEGYEWIEARLEKDKHPTRVGLSLILTKNRYLHVLNTKKMIHFKIHLSAFLPVNIYKKYRNYH